jgi:hypothetical protein
VHLVTDPVGAEIYTGDGALIGNAPLDVRQPPAGSTTVLTIRMAGYQDRSFTVSSLTASEVTVSLERERSVHRGHRPVAPVVSQPVAQPVAQPLAPTPTRPRGGGGNAEIINPF